MAVNVMERGGGWRRGSLSPSEKNTSLHVPVANSGGERKATTEEEEEEEGC